MIKPNSLRTRFTSLFPELAANPDRLKLWIEEGHVRCHAGPAELGGNLSFTLEYKLTVYFEEWDKPSLLIWPILADWLRVQQPDLLTVANSPTAIPFEADLISNDKADISFDLMLTEPVRVIARGDGGFDMEVIAEPEPDPVPGPLTSIWEGGVQLLPSTLPQDPA